MFNTHILIVFFLTTIIHFIGVSMLASRIVASRTKKFAASSVTFNVIFLFSQFATTIQAPLLTKYVETNISSGNPPNDAIFRYIILSSTLGAVLGALAIPSIHRFMEKGVNAVHHNHSIFLVLLKSAKFSTVIHLKESIKIANKQNYSRLLNFKDLKIRLILLQVFVYSFTTVSVLSCLYAGFLNPELRTTSLSLSSVAIGLGTLGTMLFLHPYDAILAEKAINGSVSEPYLRRHLSFVAIARITGTILGQVLFIPLAQLIANISAFL